MKKYEILINNVERVANYTKLGKEIKSLKMNRTFTNKKLKELAKKVPKKFDKESIKKFERETGLNIKYYVFEDKYTFYEYNRYGIYPDNSKVVLENGKYICKMGKSLEYADIVVIDKVTNYIQ